MNQYKNGTKFVVCGHDELIKKGWIHDSRLDKYTHKDFHDCSINESMLEEHEGDTFTIKSESHKENWYHVEEEDYYIWPVGTFLLIGTFVDDENDHACVEGMTEIFGWMICKTCGKNLRQIR